MDSILQAVINDLEARLRQLYGDDYSFMICAESKVIAVHAVDSKLMRRGGKNTSGYEIRD